MKPKSTLRTFLLAGTFPSASAWTHMSALMITCSLMLGNTAQADQSWTGAVSGVWNTAGNWSTGVPASNNTETLLFGDGPTNRTITMAGNAYSGTMSFSGSSDYDFGSGIYYFINSNAITIASTSSANIHFSAGQARFNQAKDYTITNNGTGLLSFDVGGTGFWKESSNGNFIFDGTGDTQLHSITKRNGAFTTSLTKGGAGTLTITNFQTTFNTTGTSNAGGLTNDTNVNGGTIRITSGDQRSLGQSGVASPTWLTLNGGALQVSTADLTINHANGGVSLGASGGTFNVDASRILTIGGGGATNIISGSGDLSKTGAGTLELSGANTSTGDFTVSAGALNLTSASELRFLIGANGVNNGMSGAGTVSLDGMFRFDLTGAGTNPGDFWNIVDVGNLSETYGGSFSVSSTLGNFSNNAGVWTIIENLQTYQFTQATGVLEIVAVPEPRAALLGAIGALLLLRRRR